MKYMRSIFALMMVILVAAACQQGGTTSDGGGGGSSSGSPADAAKVFMEAAFSGDTEAVRGVICEAQSAVADTVVEAYSSISASIPGDVTLDFSGLTYTASDVTANSANVAIGGEIKITAAGVETPVPLGDVTSFPMIVENGAWKICPPTGG